MKGAGVFIQVHPFSPNLAGWDADRIRKSKFIDNFLYLSLQTPRLSSQFHFPYTEELASFAC